MRILGFMGSPRTKGLCAQFTESALSGAASRGAEVKQFNLAKYHIKYCRGCYKCVHKNHELPIGKCPLRDDMAGILAEYLEADGYMIGYDPSDDCESHGNLTLPALPLFTIPTGNFLN